MTRYALDRLIEFLPQKPPFRFVDHVTAHETGAFVEGLVCFRRGHAIFDGHLPDEPLVPGVILVEALAQISGLALVEREGAPVRGYLAEVGKTRFHRLVRPDEQITLRAELEQSFGPYARFRVLASVEGERSVEGEITVARTE